MTTAARPTVVIFCDHLLYLSETFIRAQGQALRQYSPAYAGSRRVAGLELPAGSCYTINPGNTAGKLREGIFKLFGKAPDLVRRLRALDPVLVHAHFGPDGVHEPAGAANRRQPSDLRTIWPSALVDSHRRIRTTQHAIAAADLHSRASYLRRTCPLVEGKLGASLPGHPDM